MKCPRCGKERGYLEFRIIKYRDEWFDGCWTCHMKHSRDLGMNSYNDNEIEEMRQMFMGVGQTIIDGVDKIHEQLGV